MKVNSIEQIGVSRIGKRKLRPPGLVGHHSWSPGKETSIYRQLLRHLYTHVYIYVYIMYCIIYIYLFAHLRSQTINSHSLHFLILAPHAGIDSDSLACTVNLYWPATCSGAWEWHQLNAGSNYKHWFSNVFNAFCSLAMPCQYQYTTIWVSWNGCWTLQSIQCIFSTQATSRIWPTHPLVISSRV